MAKKLADLSKAVNQKDREQWKSGDGEGKENEYTEWKLFAPEEADLAIIAASGLSSTEFKSGDNMKNGFEVPRWVKLSDGAMVAISLLNINNTLCRSYWPCDFTSTGCAVKDPSRSHQGDPTLYFQKDDGSRIPYSISDYVFGGTLIGYDDDLESEDVMKGNAAKKKSGTTSAAQAIQNISRQAGEESSANAAKPQSSSMKASGPTSVSSVAVPSSRLLASDTTSSSSVVQRILKDKKSSDVRREGTPQAVGTALQSRETRERDRDNQQPEATRLQKIKAEEEAASFDVEVLSPPSSNRGGTHPDTTSIDPEVYASLIRGRMSITFAAERLDAALCLMNEVVNESGNYLKTMASKYPKDAKTIEQTRNQLKRVQANAIEARKESIMKLPVGVRNAVFQTHKKPDYQKADEVEKLEQRYLQADTGNESLIQWYEQEVLSFEGTPSD